MTGLGRTSALLRVCASHYAVLMLINGQLTNFDVSVGVCEPALLAAAPFEYRFDGTHTPLGLTGPSSIKATSHTPTGP